MQPSREHRSPTCTSPWVVHRVAADGHCFFAAVGTQTGIDPYELRRICRRIYTALPRKERELIALSEGLTDVEYARAITGTMYGGHNEMVLLSRELGKPFDVYEVTRNRFTLLTSVGSKESSCRVRLLWSGRCHYDALFRR